MDTKELEALDLLHYSPIDESGGVLGPPFPEVHNHLLSLDRVEGEVVVQSASLWACSSGYILSSRRSPPFKVGCNMGIKMVRLVPTCRLLELDKKSVIKGWPVFNEVAAVASHQLHHALFVNQSLGCFWWTHVNVTKDVTETGTNFFAILKL